MYVASQCIDPYSERTVTERNEFSPESISLYYSTVELPFFYLFVY